MGFALSTVVAFLFVSGAALFVLLLLGRFLRMQVPGSEKLSTYECGERPFGGAWFNFNNRFYVIALVFVALEAAIALCIPVAVALRQLLSESSGTAVPVFLLFFGFIAVVLVYVWCHDDISWVRDIRAIDRKPPALNG